MLFSQLSKYTRQRENQLSEAFAALYAASPRFRAVVTRLLRQRLGRDVRPTWVCSTQERATTRSGNAVFFDITLRSPVGGKCIVLENKIDQVLKEAQLVTYKKTSAVEQVVAITAKNPEVPLPRLRALGIQWIRWQEIYVALEAANPKRPLDRFLFESFSHFLTEGVEPVAYREDITAKDLARIGTMLGSLSGRGQVRSRKTALFGLRDAAALVAMLDDVADSLHASYFVEKKWKRSGPWCATSGDAKDPFLSINFKSKRKSRPYMMFGFSLVLRPDGELVPELYWVGCHEDEGHPDGRSWSIPMDRLMQGEHLSPRKLEDEFLARARKLHLI